VKRGGRDWRERTEGNDSEKDGIREGPMWKKFGDGVRNRFDREEIRRRERRREGGRRKPLAR
jgi:hypothetical protein